MKKLVPWIIALVLMAGFLLFQTLGGFARSPQEVTLSLARSTKVANGRAEIWFSAVDDVYENGRIQEAAMTEVVCGADSQMISVLPEWSDEVCGIRLKVLEIKRGGVTGNHPIARFEIRWE